MLTLSGSSLDRDTSTAFSSYRTYSRNSSRSEKQLCIDPSILDELRSARIEPQVE